MPPMTEYFDMIAKLWDSKWLTNNGSYHQELEKKLKEYLNVENICLMTNGHIALEAIIEAMELSGEIITTPYTFISTVHAMVRKGLTPVFCDIRREDYTIDTSKIEPLITKQTSAILVVHPYGFVCNIEEIERLAKKHGLKVIYDAAHTFGETYKGKSVASYGDASILSFHATKVFHTVEGGAVVFHDEETGQKLCGLKNFGIRSEERIDMVGGNAKMDEFRAAMGICNLRYINEELEKRRRVDAKYRSLLSQIPGIYLVKTEEDVISNYAYFPVLFDEVEFGATRDDVYEYLKSFDIYSRKYFYPIATEAECYKEKFLEQKTPVAGYVSEHILCLPIYADLSLESVEMIVGKIMKVKGNGRNNGSNR